VYEGKTITEAQTTTLLLVDVQSFQNSVNSLVTRTVTQNMSDALVSFAYNVGAGTLAASDLLAHVNAGSFSAAAGQFDLYINLGWHRLGGTGQLPCGGKALFLNGAGGTRERWTLPTVRLM
jgi:lysozyme